MAKFTLSTSKVMINSVDLTDHCETITIDLNFDQLDATAFNDAVHNYLMGLEGDSVQFNFQQDFASGKTDATLYAVWAGKAAVPISVAMSSAALSATNPVYEWAGAMLPKYTPISGSPGDKAMTSVTFICTSAVVRDVTAD